MPKLATFSAIIFAIFGNLQHHPMSIGTVSGNPWHPDIAIFGNFGDKSFYRGSIPIVAKFSSMIFAGFGKFQYMSIGTVSGDPWYPDIAIYGDKSLYRGSMHTGRNLMATNLFALEFSPSFAIMVFATYGFQVMDTCKSPKYPFEIFRSCFDTAPSVIIYDNACKFHQYCLNRGASVLQAHTIYCGQISLDKHSVDLRGINCQANEQANAGLQGIRGQLSYMTLDNFMFTVSLFCALRIRIRGRN